MFRIDTAFNLSAWTSDDRALDNPIVKGFAKTAAFIAKWFGYKLWWFTKF